MINFLAIKVFVIGGICKLLKQSGKVVFAEACCFCNVIKGKIFRAVFINIIADGKKTIQIFCGPASKRQDAKAWYLPIRERISSMRA